MFGNNLYQPHYPPTNFGHYRSPQANFHVDYMFNNNSQSESKPVHYPYPQNPQQSILPSPFNPAFTPTSPTLNAVRPQQPPSVLGQQKVEVPPAPAPSPAPPNQSTTRTTIIPLMNPNLQEPSTPSRHQRGLSSVVHNTSIVGDNSSDEEEDEDQEDYEARIERNEQKTDEAVKRKVMTALQSALSDLQLTGIQIKWSDIEVDDRIGVGGFAIVYHGMYRYVLIDYHSIIQSFTITYSFIQSFNHSIIHSFTHSLFQSSVLSIEGVKSQSKRSE